MNLSEPFIRHPVMTAVLTASVILFGVLSYFELWPERVLGSVFGDPARLYESDPEPRSPRKRRR